MNQKPYIDNYAWRHELVASEQSAKAFLERELKKRGIKCKLAWDVTPMQGETEFSISADIKGIDCPAFYATGRVFDDALVVDTFSVSPILSDVTGTEPCYKGMNISLIGLKALIAIGYHYAKGLQTIDLVDVAEDGPRYWARLSAMPEHGIDLMAQELAQAFGDLDEERYCLLRGSERDAQLMEVLALSKNLPHRAFKKMAEIKRAKGIAGGDYIDEICDRVIGAICGSSRKKIMVINMMDERSTTILGAKLGILPTALAPANFAEVAEETALRHDGTEVESRDDAVVRAVRARFLGAEI